MEGNFNNCQSCGLPLHITVTGGTNEDGSKSKKYCIQCYENGEFIYPSLSRLQMQLRMRRKLKEIGFPDFFARLFISEMGNLERWKPKASRESGPDIDK